MAKTVTLVTKNPLVCYWIARDEAQRYQRMATRARERGNPEKHRACICKRDAAYRIALLIRFGSVARALKHERRTGDEETKG